MTATSGMENAVGSGKLSTREDRLHRGRKVVSAFLMQGWGQFLNQIILILLLLCFNSGSGNPPYDKVVAQWTFRVSFAIPAVGTLWLVYYRTYKMRSASKQLQVAKKKSSVTGYDVQSLKYTFRYFGGRIIATAVGWVRERLPSPPSVYTDRTCQFSMPTTFSFTEISSFRATSSRLWNLTTNQSWLGGFGTWPIAALSWPATTSHRSWSTTSFTAANGSKSLVSLAASFASPYQDFVTTITARRAFTVTRPCISFRPSLVNLGRTV